jgi:CBS domain-containing protein
MPRVSEVMTRDVEVIRPDDTLKRAAQLMDDLNVGSLPVCERSDLIGMITDRDITVRAVADGMDPNETRVSEVMTAQAHSCTEDQTIEEVMAQMGDMQIRRLPVVNKGGQIIGIVSLGDLATRQSSHVDNALREISTPSEPDRSIA